MTQYESTLNMMLIYQRITLPSNINSIHNTWTIYRLTGAPGDPGWPDLPSKPSAPVMPSAPCYNKRTE